MDSYIILFLVFLNVILVLLTIIFYIKTKTDVKKANAKLFHGICKELDAESRWLNDIVIIILDEVKEKKR